MEGTPPLSLKNIFKSKVFPALYNTEILRKRILLNSTIISIVILIGFALEAVTWMSVGIAIVIIFSLAYTSRFGVSISDFTKSYQSIVGKTIASQLIPNAIYNYDSYHKLRLLNEAHLINGFPAQYGGRHLLTFMENDLSCAISEIESHTHHKNVQGFTKRLHVFNGLVGLANLQIELSDPIIIISKNLVNTSKEDISRFPTEYEIKDELIIYNADLLVLNRFISPEAWLQLKLFTANYNKDIFISIYKTGICVAVHSSGYLKPAIFKTAYKKELAESYFNDLQFISIALHLFCKSYTEVISTV